MDRKRKKMIVYLEGKLEEKPLHIIEVKGKMSRLRKMKNMNQKERN